MTASPKVPRAGASHRLRHGLAHLGALGLLVLAALVVLLAVALTVGISDEYGLTAGDVIAIWTPATGLVVLLALGGVLLWRRGR